MEIVRISTSHIIQIIPFKESTITEETAFLRSMISSNPDFLIECVHPKRLYREVGMDEKVCMLVDEEGRIKKLPINFIGSWLYETDKHGNPIVGNALIVGEKRTKDGIDFCGLSQDKITRLIEGLSQLPIIVELGEEVRI